MEHIGRLGVTNRKDEAAAAAAAEMILEGLWAHRRIGRSEERGFYAEKPQRAAEPREARKSATVRGARTTEVVRADAKWMLALRPSMKIVKYGNTRESPPMRSTSTS